MGVKGTGAFGCRNDGDGLAEACTLRHHKPVRLVLGVLVEDLPATLLLLPLALPVQPEDAQRFGGDLGLAGMSITLRFESDVHWT